MVTYIWRIFGVPDDYIRWYVITELLDPKDDKVWSRHYVLVIINKKGLW